VRSEDRLWFIARGFKPGEKPARAVRQPDGKVTTDEVEADARGVVVWSARLGPGSRYEPREVELRGEAGACSAKYFGRVP
jgi:hypothetical protein